MSLERSAEMLVRYYGWKYLLESITPRFVLVTMCIYGLLCLIGMNAPVMRPTTLPSGQACLNEPNFEEAWKGVQQDIQPYVYYHHAKHVAWMIVVAGMLEQHLPACEDVAPLAGKIMDRFNADPNANYFIELVRHKPHKGYNLEGIGKTIPQRHDREVGIKGLTTEDTADGDFESSQPWEHPKDNIVLGTFY